MNEANQRLSSKIIGATLLVVLLPVFILGELELHSYLKTTIFLYDDFRGEYRLGGGTFGCSLQLNADKTFNNSAWPDLGEAQHMTGTVFVENNQFLFQPDPVCAPSRLVPIRWGERRYLLSDEDDDIKSYFCEAVKNGYDWSLIYLRKSELRVPVSGFPVYLNGERVCL